MFFYLYAGAISGTQEVIAQWPSSRFAPLFSTPAPDCTNRAECSESKGKKRSSIRNGHAFDYARLAAGVGVVIGRSKSGLAGLAFTRKEVKIGGVNAGLKPIIAQYIKVNLIS